MEEDESALQCANEGHQNGHSDLGLGHHVHKQLIEAVLQHGQVLRASQKVPIMSGQAPTSASDKNNLRRLGTLERRLERRRLSTAGRSGPGPSRSWRGAGALLKPP